MWSLDLSPLTCSVLNTFLNNFCCHHLNSVFYFQKCLIWSTVATALYSLSLVEGKTVNPDYITELLRACHWVHSSCPVFRGQRQKSLAYVDNHLCSSTIVSMENVASVELCAWLHLSTANNWLVIMLLYNVPWLWLFSLIENNHIGIH